MGYDVRGHRWSLGVYLAALITALNFLIDSQHLSAADVKISQLQADAESGSVPREVELAGDYVSGRGLPQDFTKAAYWYEMAAGKGDPAAQNEIGVLYQAGMGVPVDPVRAFHWFQLSAAAGFIRAKVNLGVAYVWGNGVSKDGALAAQLFREAANSGSGAAATYLGDLYYFGTGVVQDKLIAEHWFETGVKMRDPIAAFDLGLLFFDKGDHPRDFPKAARLLRQAASAGYVPAMYSLGLLLTAHPELARSPDEVRISLETAAGNGSWKSSAVLGILAREGNGVAQNPAAAYYHFQVAILQGGEPAQHLLVNDLGELSKKLSAEQTRELTSNAATWFQQHHLSLAFVNKDGENQKHFSVRGRATDDEGMLAERMIPPPPAGSWKQASWQGARR